MSTVLIAGGSGLVGRYLSKYLHDKGYSIKILSRYAKPENPYPTFIWNLTSGYIDEAAFTNVDHIINLSGENIGSKKWTSKRKEAILSSRVQSTQLLFKKVTQLNIPLKSFISASAVGYYGAITSEKIFTETDYPAKDFLGSICEKWEAASYLFAEHGIRTAQIRTGLVLTPKSGALEKITTPIKKGFGAVLGSGKQYVPWIHIKDLCSLYEFTLRNSNMEGAYNAVAPEYINQRDVTYSIAKSLNKKIWLPKLPAFLLKLLLGEMANLILFGSRVSAQKILNAGFEFEFPKLAPTLKILFR